jgi:protein TonB
MMGLPSERDSGPELFRGLVVSDPEPHKRGVSLPVSVAGHAVALVLLVVVPILWPGDPPETPDIVARLIYNPPPPPPPPLPQGSAMLEKAHATTPETKTEPDPDRLTAEIPEVKPQPEQLTSPEEQAGDPDGSMAGVVGGDAEGQDGGVLGGVPNGVIGGVVGGTGDGPVMDYDTQPRLLHQARPQYPQEAFVKKIEGTVELEILIDASGQVATARVTRSIPLLDAAALACVKQWRFAPAMKHGRPVATIARAPVTFRIF